MPVKFRTRFRIEAILALLTAALTVMTLISREWIEVLFGVDPDGGSGALEWAIVAALFAMCMTFSAFGYAEWKKLIAEGAITADLS